MLSVESAHGSNDEEGGEVRVVEEEGGAIVVVEEDGEERQECDEDDEDDDVEDHALEFLRGGVGRVLNVDEVGGGGDGCGDEQRGERVNQQNHKEHANRDRAHHADYLHICPETFQNSIPFSQILGIFWFWKLFLAPVINKLHFL